VRLATLVVLAIGGPAAPAHAEPSGDAVALLPLDADRSLEIYGQPIAGEIARALVAGDVAVVVVGPKTAVPERARLIIDGTIALGKASAVTISLRVRSTLDGTVLDTLTATAPGLAKIDGAAADLAARALPLVKDRLAALRRPIAPVIPAGPVGDRGGVPAAAPPRRTSTRVLVAVGDARRGAHDALLGALQAATGPWARAHQREPQTVEPTALEAKRAMQAVRTSGAGFAIALSILAYAPEAGALPMARARVRVQISDTTGVVFDRVVATDTVLGDKGLPADALAARVAREVLAIVEPHLQRSVPAWR